MKRYTVNCPYCGAEAILKPSSMVFGIHTEDAKQQIYVCRNWPACDSYVFAHRKDGSPMGTLANKELRQKRIQTHKVFSAYQKATKMKKWAAYIWLEGKLGLTEKTMHIGLFSSEDCDRAITLLNEALTAYRRQQNGRSAA